MSQTGNLPSFSPPDTQHSLPAGVLERIKKLTGEFFPGPVSFAEEHDPSEPANHYVVFTVSAAGPWKGVRDKVIQWHRRVAELCPNPSNYFRLDVHCDEAE